MMSEPLHFVCLMGMPGSGKSTLAKDDRFEGYTIVDSDEVRLSKQFKGKPKIQTELAYEETCLQVYQALVAGNNVVLDAPSPSPTRRSVLGLVELAENQNQVPIYRELVVLRIPTQTCFERNAARGKEAVEEEFMQRHYVHFEKGLTEIGTEGWDNIQFVYE